MRSLIALSDITKLHAENKRTVYIERDTIITPSARDYAKSNNMEFVEKKQDNVVDKFDLSSISKEDLYQILKSLVDKGLLDNKYNSVKTPNGFKIVRGNSVKLDPLFPETHGDSVQFLEVIHDTESPMQSGYFTINQSSFSTVTEVYETYTIVEGGMDIRIDGTCYRASCGDIVSIPKGSSIECSCEGFVKVFYSCADK